MQAHNEDDDGAPSNNGAKAAQVQVVTKVTPLAYVFAVEASLPSFELAKTEVRPTWILYSEIVVDAFVMLQTVHTHIITFG